MTRNTDFDDFLNSADAAFDASMASAPARPVAKEERHTCPRCLGSGKYRGPRFHQQDDTCFACGGRGWHKMSYADRMARKAKTQATQARNLETRKAAFLEEHKALIDGLRVVPSEFCNSLLAQFGERGSLTENQIRAGYAAIERHQQRAVERQAARDANSGNVEVARIRQLFDTASGNGLKKPVLRAEGLVLKLASQHGRNPGAIYVTKGDEYVGKIIGTRFEATRSADATILPALQTISTEPREAAIRYGRLTGVCGCCGRELTDPESIAKGIGPICEAKWF